MLGCASNWRKFLGRRSDVASVTFPCVRGRTLQATAQGSFRSSGADGPFIGDHMLHDPSKITRMEHRSSQP